MHKRIKYPRAHATSTERRKLRHKIRETMLLTDKQGVAVIRGSVLHVDA